MVIQTSEGIAVRVSKHVNKITVAGMDGTQDIKLPLQAMLNDKVDIKTQEVADIN